MNLKRGAVMNIMDKFSLKGKVSIITGGERGIGFAIASAFAQAGSDIVIAGMDDSCMDDAVEKIKAYGNRCIAIKTDVTKESDVDSMVEKVLATFGMIDVLVNNAGISSGAPAESMPLSQFNKVMEVNTNGVFITSKAVGNVMLKQGKGSIVNIASMSSMIVNNPQPQVNYNASKAAVVMITKSMACEWAQRGVRVNGINPGYTRSPLIKRRFESKDSIIDRWLSMTPMGRIAEPEEIAGAALYLASDASTFTTGALINVDGGYSCW
jgi:NAD(P)-dependent dehydrogenase (short-subunit alcohol dehydrogenase family)